MNETEILSARFRDLAKKSYTSNIFTFSNFLGEGELDVLFSMERELKSSGLTVFGGFEGAGRCVARFGSEDDFGYSVPFPIACLKIEPLILKFGENLSHRDYLGALMNLGIERDLIGDILIKEKIAYVFCLDHIKEYILEKLGKVRHTNVKISILEEIPDIIKPTIENHEIVVPSERLDAVISKLYNMSRSQSLTLFRTKKIFVNGRQQESNSHICKNGDIVSVRGHGKFVYNSIAKTTAKGKFRVCVGVYK